MFYNYQNRLTLVILLFFSVVVCKAQTTTEKKQSSSLPPLKIIFDDSNAQLLGIDTSGHIIENGIIAFQLFVNIKGITHSEQALGNSLSKSMLDLVNQADENTIFYFEHIQVKTAAGTLVEAENIQYKLGYKATRKNPY